MWEFAPSGGLIEEIGGIGGAAFLGVEPAAEDLDGGEVACDGGGFEVSVALEGGDVFGEGGGCDAGGIGDAGGGEGVEKVAEVSPVGLDGGGGEAALDADVREEVGSRALELWREVVHVWGFGEYRRAGVFWPSGRRFGPCAQGLRCTGGFWMAGFGHAV